MNIDELLQITFDKLEEDGFKSEGHGIIKSKGLAVISLVHVKNMSHKLTLMVLEDLMLSCGWPEFHINTINRYNHDGIIDKELTIWGTTIPGGLALIKSTEVLL